MKNEPDQILALSQEHYATQFPNPERIGCPVPGTLTSVIWSGRLLDQELRQHLFACSECFNEYRAQLAAFQQQAASQETLLWWQWWRGIRTAKWAFVFAALVITSIGGWLVWQQVKAPRQPEVAITATPGMNNQIPTPPVATQGQEEKAEPKPSRPRSEPLPVIASAATQKIELDDYAVLRNVKTGALEDKDKTIRLFTERTRLQLVLSEGSTKGNYIVSLIDAFGRPISRGRAISSDGKTLTVTLDLRWIKADSYRLQIARGNEAPDYYPVKVTEKHVSNK